MMTAALRCPHCSNQIRFEVSIQAPTYGEHFKALTDQLRALPAPFTSHEALIIAKEITGAPWTGYRLWDEFRMFGHVRRVHPGLRWVLIEKA